MASIRFAYNGGTYLADTSTGSFVKLSSAQNAAVAPFVSPSSLSATDGANLEALCALIRTQFVDDLLDTEVTFDGPLSAKTDIRELIGAIRRLEMTYRGVEAITPQNPYIY